MQDALLLSAAVVVLLATLRLPLWRLAIWASVLVALFSFICIFVSVHYTTDLVASFMVGGFWLLVGFALSEHGRGIGQKPFAAMYTGPPLPDNRHVP